MNYRRSIKFAEVLRVKGDHRAVVIDILKNGFLEIRDLRTQQYKLGVFIFIDQFTCIHGIHVECTILALAIFSHFAGHQRGLHAFIAGQNNGFPIQPMNIIVLLRRYF